MMHKIYARSIGSLFPKSKRNLLLAFYSLMLCFWAAAGFAQSYQELHQFCDNYGYQWNYYPGTNELELTKAERIIRILIQTNKISINGTRHYFLSTPVTYENGQLNIPLELLSLVNRYQTESISTHQYQSESKDPKTSSEKPLDKAQEKPVLAAKARVTQDDPDEPENQSGSIRYVIIDPGHGGKDSGAVNEELGIQEKDIALDVALLVYKDLKKKHKDLHVLITRADDTFLELAQRVQIAMDFVPKNQRGIFVCIHANALPSALVKGVETYYYSDLPNPKRAKVTRNRQKLITEEYIHNKLTQEEALETILFQMFNHQISKASKNLADAIQRNVIAHLPRDTIDRGIKQDVIRVISYTNMPAALCEIGFVTNNEEAKRLTTSSYQHDIADGIVKGILEYLGP